MNTRNVEFTHPVLNEQVSAIGGHYVFTREVRAVFAGREMLYYTGYFVMDRSCCGVGGCAYALVAGFVQDWHCGSAADGRPVSRVRPVTDSKWQASITAGIKNADPMIQVSFLPAEFG
ncbi:MAG: hypothetical protein K9K62_01375 [Desulfobacteraceae bacterium]|nr:hypothetical protein [Desulfobacteraceae bacterium]